MKNKVKRFQLWLNKRYEVVRFYVAMVTAVFVILILMGQNHALNRNLEEVARENQARQEQMKLLLREMDGRTTDIKATNDRNTHLIICLLAVHGETAFVTPSDEQECRRVIDEGVNGADETSIINSRPQTTPQQSTSPQTTPTQPTQPSNSEPNLIERVIEFFEPAVDRIFGE